MHLNRHIVITQFIAQRSWDLPSVSVECPAWSLIVPARAFTHAVECRMPKRFPSGRLGVEEMVAEPFVDIPRGRRRTLTTIDLGALPHPFVNFHMNSSCDAVRKAIIIGRSHSWHACSCQTQPIEVCLCGLDQSRWWNCCQID